MDQGIGRIIAAPEKNGQLDNTLLIFLADNGACAGIFSRTSTVDELVHKLMIKKSHADQRARPFRQQSVRHAGAGEHLSERGRARRQPVEHAVSPLQAPDPRGRHLSTLLIVHWPAGIKDKDRHTRATCPDIMARRSSTSAARPTPIRGRARRSSRPGPVAGTRHQRDVAEWPPMLFWSNT